MGPRLPIRPRTPRDGSRTRAEAHLAFPDVEEERDEVEVGARRFNLQEIASGLPDDSREADKRAECRHPVDRRSRVKIARTVLSRMPGLAAILRERPDRAARFYARFGVSEAFFGHGVSAGDAAVALLENYRGAKKNGKGAFEGHTHRRFLAGAARSR